MQRSIIIRTSCYNIFPRIDYPWAHDMKRVAWKNLKNEMIAHFQERPMIDTKVTIEAKVWPRFATKEQIYDEGMLPARIGKYGQERGICLPMQPMLDVAFDEEKGHLSHLFKARLYHIDISELGLREICAVSKVKTDVVEKKLYFVNFQRHVAFKHYTEVEVPLTLIGLYGCPAALSGAHIDLVKPTVKCEVIGDYFPAPFNVDCSRLKNPKPYGKITMESLIPLLPKDGTVRFSREYEDLSEVDIVYCYEPQEIPEQPLPADYQDPNFFNRLGKKVHLTYTGYWPKQSTRS